METWEVIKNLNEERKNVPAGRPTKLTPKSRKQANDYYVNCLTNNKVPTHAGLAVELDVSKSTIYKWAEEDKEFSDTLAGIKTLQELKLVDGGLTNQLNPTITKLMLSNHGYSETQKIDQHNTGEIKIVKKVYHDKNDNNSV